MCLQGLCPAIRALQLPRGVDQQVEHAPVIVPGDFIGGGAGRDPHWEPSVSRSVGTSFAASSMCRSRSACASRDYAPKATPTSFDIRSRRASMPVRRSSPTAS